VNRQYLVGDFPHSQRHFREHPVQTNPRHGVSNGNVRDGGIELQPGAVPEVSFFDQYDFSTLGDPEKIVDRRMIGRMAVIDGESVPGLHLVLPQHLAAGVADHLQQHSTRVAAADLAGKEDEDRGECPPTPFRGTP